MISNSIFPLQQTAVYSTNFRRKMHTTAATIRPLPSQPPATTVRRLTPARVCCSPRNDSYVPKLEPFNQRKLDRIIRDPPLIKKAENDIADYCSTLEGDASYSCWRAYFELKQLEEEAPKEEVEKVILESGGVKSLIGFLHGISEIHRASKQLHNQDGLNSNLCKSASRARRDCPVPDGLPKSLEEMEEEENWKMPDSSFTRLLRSKGTFPAWYSPVPDHETD